MVVVWPFSKKKKSTPPALVFRDGKAFLEFQCKYGHTEITPGQGVVAYVIDAATEFGVPNAVRRQPNGTQLAMLKVASEDGGFLVASTTATDRGDDLNAGDTVIWVPAQYNAPMVDAVDGVDPRFGWIGFIVAKIKPEIDPAAGSFTILSRYD